MFNLGIDLIEIRPNGEVSINFTCKDNLPCYLIVDIEEWVYGRVCETHQKMLHLSRFEIAHRLEPIYIKLAGRIGVI